MDPRLVLIEWEDSAQPVAAWRFLDDIPEGRPHRCQTVGHLIRDDEGAKVVALSLATSAEDGAWDQAAGVATIPTKAILRLVDLCKMGA